MSIYLRENYIYKFLETTMNKSSIRKITICGSCKDSYEEMDMYRAYLTIHNNIVNTPINYLKYLHHGHNHKIIVSEKDMNILRNIHNLKISECGGILVILKENIPYIGEDTLKEIEYARSLDKVIIFNKIPVIFSSSEDLLEWEQKIIKVEDNHYTMYAFKKEEDLDEFIKRIS